MNRILFALAIVLAPLMAHAEPSAAKPEVAFELDTSAMPDNWSTDYIKEHLVEHQLRILQGGGLEVVDGAAATIRVTLSHYGKNDVNSRFTVALYEDGAETATVERTLTCEACTDTDLFVKVGEEVARQSGRLLYAADEGEPQVEERPSTAPQPSEDTTLPTTDHGHVRVRRIGGLGYAGFGLALAGVGFGIGGAVVLREPLSWDLRSGLDGIERGVEKRRPLGLGLVGTGGVLLAAAVGLVVADQTIMLERRRNRALVPSVSTSAFGLLWSGRF